MNPEEMRQRAQQYRKMAILIEDPLALQALLELAGQYEAQAEDAERRDKPDGPDTIPAC
jgi:hypothetical protein